MTTNDQGEKVVNTYYKITPTQATAAMGGKFEFYVPSVYYKRVGGKNPVLCQEPTLAAAVGIDGLTDTDQIPSDKDIKFYKTTPNVKTTEGEEQLIVAEWTTLKKHCTTPSDTTRFTVEGLSPNRVLTI